MNDYWKNLVPAKRVIDNLRAARAVPANYGRGPRPERTEQFLADLASTCAKYIECARHNLCTFERRLSDLTTTDPGVAGSFTELATVLRSAFEATQKVRETLPDDDDALWDAVDSSGEPIAAAAAALAGLRRRLGLAQANAAPGAQTVEIANC